MKNDKTPERAEIIAALGAIEVGGVSGKYHGPYLFRMQDALTDAAALLEQDAEPPNEPLTLEELRGMSNKDWVWVVFPQLPPEENCWYRAKKLYDLYSHAHYGETWLAYRRKPG